MSLSAIERQQLLAATLGSRNVSTVDVRRMILAPGQRTGRHLHPCPVVGYIASGTAVYEIEGRPAELLPVGSAFYEPAETVIAEFGNASDIMPLTFIAIYLLHGEQELITMLDSTQPSYEEKHAPRNQLDGR
jgi:quercetin dioxygenase-like cupin family protein